MRSAHRGPVEDEQAAPFEGAIDDGLGQVVIVEDARTHLAVFRRFLESQRITWLARVSRDEWQSDHDQEEQYAHQGDARSIVEPRLHEEIPKETYWPKR